MKKMKKKLKILSEKRTEKTKKKKFFEIINLNLKKMKKK